MPKTRLYVHLSKDVVTTRNVGSGYDKNVIYEMDAVGMVNANYVFYLLINGVVD